MGRIDELRIVLPWGSLLRAVLAADADLVALMANGLRPGGCARVIVSLTPADEHRVGVSAADGGLQALARACVGSGLDVTCPRALERADTSEIRSSWAKRLGVPARRPATILRVRREPRDEAPTSLDVTAGRPAW